MSNKNNPINPTQKKPLYLIKSHYEEVANGITHGIGTALSVIGLILLIVIAVNQGDARHIASFAIYGTSLFLLYLASTLYHSFRKPILRKIFQIVDHSCIYLLIAGTYTPFLIVGIGGSFGTIMLAVIWSIAIAGIIFKVFFINRFMIASTLAYVGMGWLAIIGWQELVASVPAVGVAWLAAGGITYSLGVIFYALEKMPFNHTIWHLFVMGGSACHFVAVIYMVP